MDLDSQATRQLRDDQSPRLTSASASEHTDDVDLAAGERVGRYEVIERIGAGGMGIVYAASDPDLDRTVAIKLLRPSKSRDTTHSEARGRLLREAQAMARLAHPNVLPVYDVGTAGERVFVAMEFVQGQTLGQWMTTGERSHDAVIAKMLLAGQGLAAAHAAGIVHRDFKPANILVSEDERVYVMDFGLARSSGGYSVDPEVTDRSSHNSIEEDLTRTGFVMGTPAYMAPEQHAGERPNPLSDQWSFCVALFEGLHRRRPFRGTTRAELGRALEAGYTEPQPSTVPPAVRAVLRRGLALSPDERWPDMDTLLAALQRARGASRRRWTALGIGAVTVPVLAIAIGGADTEPSIARCDDAAVPARLAWNGEHRDAIAASFQATGVSWAGDTGERAVGLLDAYGEHWTAMREAACEASASQPASDDGLLDLKMACLDQRLEALSGVVAMLRRADRKTVDGSVRMVAGLPPLAACNDDDALRETVAPPTDLAVLAEVAAIERDVDRASALRQGASYKDGLVVAEPLLARADRTEYAPARIKALQINGLLQTDVGNVDAGMSHLEAALWLAEEHGMDRRVADIAIKLLYFSVVTQRDAQQATRWAELARAKVDLVGRGGVLEAALHSRLADAADLAGEYETARTHATTALTRWETLEPGSFEHAAAIAAIGKTRFRDQHWEAAGESFTQAADMLSALVGERHPDVAKARANVAIAAHAAGDYPRAKTELLRGLPLFEEMLGKDHGSVAVMLTNLGNAHYRLGEFEEALAVGERALAIKRKDGGDGSNVAYSLNNVGMILLSLQRFEEAAARYEAAIELLSAAMGEDHPALANSLEGLGEVRLAEGRPADALSPLRRALEIEAKLPESSRAISTFMLARALWETGTHAEALLLATDAHAWASAAQDQDQILRSLAATSRKWLDEHAT